MAGAIDREVVSMSEDRHVPNVKVRPAVITSPYVNGEHLTALHTGFSAVLASSVDLVMNTGGVSIDPEKMIEQRRSAHQVGFGSLIARQRTGFPATQGRRCSEQAIALKPFKHPEDALAEVRGYLTLAELGVETFEPIGVFPASRGEHFVAVTKKRNDLTSLDREKWVAGRQVVDEASLEISERNNETVKGIAELNGYINSNAVFHIDGQIKNYAKTPAGKVGIIDTENLVITSPDDPRVVDLAWGDIEKLVNSLIRNNGDARDSTIFGVGMLHGLSLQSARSSIEELILIPYQESLARELEGASAEKSELIQRLFDGVTERFYSDQTWPSHFIEASK